ncbi:hypothetical protein EDI_299250 [Entamoeba dispar SAW760]|uniref:Uncharacterized protein n=1 Tax=Entamoeba dispar (strain ATCC PRA-260 / SAW760) TaxID=370354 RepID=B0E7E4_ENTDS|nr:uncharacterized protein EDI_299250 [Entamoeba dispar SAW760]XP_001735285.1 uncharacterized protein EDI_050960 [Entamoeba dispar SAW760]EDR28524.1 hypothetical protein EDI_050960 [Entamoeba dispar SAW760]EDR29550.1 hypothetical protein EDI_299250 [Entamoeba dispar SAW760]|eukprot:EDR28524.1 hypothetical protein EDI_050960 [Entamoeba dispar SAW760]
MIIFLILLVCTTFGYEPFFEEINCQEFNKNCRECVRYVQNFKDNIRGCQWCDMPNYFDSYCFNPNTTICKGKIQEICQLDPLIMSVVSVLCLLPLLIVILLIVLPSLISCIKKRQTKQD